MPTGPEHVRGLIFKKLSVLADRAHRFANGFNFDQPREQSTDPIALSWTPCPPEFLYGCPLGFIVEVLLKLAQLP